MVNEITPDIFLVELPLPFALRQVNCYLIQGDHGWTIFDTGINTVDGQMAWRAALQEMGIGWEEIEQIIISHPHPDHYGLAGWLQGQCLEHAHIKPTVRHSPGTGKVAALMGRDAQVRADETTTFFQRCGMSADAAVTTSVEMVALQRGFLPHPLDPIWIEPGSTLKLGNRTFRAIHAPGHSDAQLIFFDEADGLILCADQVLTRISPNISIWPSTQPNPLGRYIESLTELSRLNVRLALPGHRSMITDWRGRLAELIHHHDQRLAEMFGAVGNRATVAEVSRKVFSHRELTSHELRFAVTETLAHLDYLVQVGSLVRTNDPTTLSPWVFRQEPSAFMGLDRIEQTATSLAVDPD